MKKLNNIQIKSIKAGKGITGSLLSGIGSIINGIGNFFNGLLSTIIGSVYMFTDRSEHHDKASYKFGNNTFSYDDSKSVDVEKEKIKIESQQAKKEAIKESNKNAEPTFTKLTDKPAHAKSNHDEARINTYSVSHHALNDIHQNDDVMLHDDFMHWN